MVMITRTMWLISSQQSWKDSYGQDRHFNNHLKVSFWLFDSNSIHNKFELLPWETGLSQVRYRVTICIWLRCELPTTLFFKYIIFIFKYKIYKVVRNIQIEVASHLMFIISCNSQINVSYFLFSIKKNLDHNIGRRKSIWHCLSLMCGAQELVRCVVQSKYQI